MISPRLTQVPHAGSSRSHPGLELKPILDIFRIDLGDLNAITTRQT